MDIGNDIQESISRSYDVPEGTYTVCFAYPTAILIELLDVDEAELDAELEALGEEVELGGEWDAETINETPSFLQGEPGIPEFVDEPPTGEKVKQAI